jgi:hypothetical protein
MWSDTERLRAPIRSVIAAASWIDRANLEVSTINRSIIGAGETIHRADLQVSTIGV